MDAFLFVACQEMSFKMNLNLVLQLVAALELVYVDEEQVDSLVSVGHHDQDDERNADHPGYDRSFEQVPSMNLAKQSMMAVQRLMLIKQDHSFAIRSL
jgi:hypothetical protein